MITDWRKRWRKRVRALVRREAVERELDEELAFHVDMEMQKNIREGMDPGEARRQAMITFGAMERYKEEVRDARYLGWVSGLSVDARLGARMLSKHPALTIVGGLGLAVAIAIAAVFDAAAGVVHAALPLDDGDRIVMIESWDAEINNQDRRILHDFIDWREQVRSMEDLSAFRTIGRNLIVPGGPVEQVPVAEMTASGFRVARVPPLLGRYLVADDEREGAPAVVVIGHGVWQSHFGSDPDVIGQEVRLGSAVHTVVGVMPPGFAFPLNHRFWTPLRVDPAAYERRGGPAIQVFGRLAPGATLRQAQAEMAAVGRRAAAELPETHRLLRPRVVPFAAHLFDDMQGWEIPFVRFLLVSLLGVICVNVAVLVYARTATRMGEITVRTALGASRRRILAQFFAEALVLTAAAAAIGLLIARLSLARLQNLAAEIGEQMGGLPFWIDLSLSPRTVLYVVGLALLAAAIVGIVPALQATGRRLQGSLRQMGGGTGMRMGRTWTLLIVSQVAFAVAVLPAAILYVWEFTRYSQAEPGFPADEYLVSTVFMDRETPPRAEAEAYQREFDGRYADRMAELIRRLREDGDVSAVTLALTTPGRESSVQVELEGVPAPAETAGHPVGFMRVDLRFLEAFDIPVLAGRALQSGDDRTSATAVVVNRSFAEQVLGGQSPIGRRLRYVQGSREGGVMRNPSGTEPGQWYEIVGMVGDLPPRPMEPGQSTARLYHALTPGTMYPAKLAVRVRSGSPETLIPRLREIAAAIDPALQLDEVLPLHDALSVAQGGMRMGALALGLITLSVLLLSAAGIYAMMSFIITRRRKEIGIRAALGADARRILGSIFGRAIAQLTLGATLGLALAALLDIGSGGELLGGRASTLLPIMAAIMIAIGLLATLGPARRGLGIQPMEALREE